MRRSLCCLVALALVFTLAPGCGGGGGAPPDNGTPPPPPPPEPTVTSVSPDSGPVAGGTPLTVMGSGFADNEPGTNVVTIGGAAASSVAVQDDASLTCLTPPGSEGEMDVVVTNDNGTATLVNGYRYVASALYAADGKGGAAGNLYRIDPVTANATTIGPIGFAVTGMAVVDDGTVYAVEATRRGTTGPSRLLTINTATGQGSVVGVLQDDSGTFVHNDIADVTFADQQLIGAKGTGMTTLDDVVHIDLATAMVTIVGGGTTLVGNGLAALPLGGQAYLVPFGLGTGGLLVLVDPGSGSGGPGPGLTGGTNAVVNAMTFHEGTLFAIDAASGGAGTSSLLVTIDVATGVITPVGPLPNDVDALVSTLP